MNWKPPVTLAACPAPLAQGPSCWAPGPLPLTAPARWSGHHALCRGWLGRQAKEHDARSMALAPWVSKLVRQPRPTDEGYRSAALAWRCADLGSWSVALEAPMKLPTIFSALPSTKAGSQAAGGPFRGGLGAPHSRCPQDKRPK